MIADQNRYHEALAKELGAVLGRKGGVMEKGIVGLDEAWCVWNRARGVGEFASSFCSRSLSLSLSQHQSLTTLFFSRFPLVVSSRLTKRSEARLDLSIAAHLSKNPFPDPAVFATADPPYSPFLIASVRDPIAGVVGFEAGDCLVCFVGSLVCECECEGKGEGEGEGGSDDLGGCENGADLNSFGRGNGGRSGGEGGDCDG